MQGAGSQRTLLPATALLLALLAGCVAPAQTAISPDASGSPVDAPYIDTVRLGGGAIVETSLAVGPDGTMLVCAHAGYQEVSPTWTSRDDGVTWQRLVVTPQTYPSGDCDVAFDASGAMAVTYLSTIGVTVATSTDGGQTWSWHLAALNPMVIVPTVIPLTPVWDRPWLAATDDGFILTVKSQNAEPFVVAFSHSGDHGASWTGLQVIPTPRRGEDYSAVMGRPLASPDGASLRFLIWWHGTEQRAPSLDFAGTTDGGATWRFYPVFRSDPRGGADVLDFESLPVLSETTSGALAVVVPLVNFTPSSDPVVVFGVNSPEGDSTVDLAVIVSRDAGKSWSSPARFAWNATGGWGALFNLWADPSGDVLDVGWRTWHEDGWSVGLARVDLQDGTAVVRDALTKPVNPDGPGGEFLAIDHDAAGRILVAYIASDDDCGTRPPLHTSNWGCVDFFAAQPELLFAAEG